MEFPNSLADLKRYLQSLKGTGKITLLEFHLNGNPSTQHTGLLLPRLITTVNSVGFGLTYTNRESFCDWPKAKDLMFYPENRVFHVTFDENCKLIYRIEE